MENENQTDNTNQPIHKLQLIRNLDGKLEWQESNIKMSTKSQRNYEVQLFENINYNLGFAARCANALFGLSRKREIIENENFMEAKRRKEDLDRREEEIKKREENLEEEKKNIEEKKRELEEEKKNIEKEKGEVKQKKEFLEKNKLDFGKEKKRFQEQLRLIRAYCSRKQDELSN